MAKYPKPSLICALELAFRWINIADQDLEAARKALRRARKDLDYIAAQMIGAGHVIAQRPVSTPSPSAVIPKPSA